MISASGLTVLRTRDFRLFFAGYTTSLLGSSMSGVAVAFAILDSGGSASDLGLVVAAVPLVQLAFMLLAGVVTDRFGPRRIMLAGDSVRCIAQTTLAAAVLTAHTALWVFIALSALRGLGEAFFTPGLSALVVRVVEQERLADANVLLGFAQSVAKVAGPTLAGLLVAATNAGIVVGVDAASYLCSLLALSLLRVRELPETHKTADARRPAMLRSLAEGWQEFKTRSWLVATTIQFTFLNFAVWGPFLVLGPVLSHQLPSGARAWGLIMGGYGAGSILGGLLILGRRPARPLLVAALATIGYAAPCALFAAQAPTSLITAGACVAGIGSTVSAALSDTVTQQHTPLGVLARVRTLQTFGAFSLGPLALALAGPVAAAVGARSVLAFGALSTVLAALSVTAVPGVRALPRLPDQTAA